MKANLIPLTWAACRLFSCPSIPSHPVTGRSFWTRAATFAKVLPPDWNRHKRAEIISTWVKKMANAGDPAAVALQPLRDAVKEQG